MLVGTLDTVSFHNFPLKNLVPHCATKYYSMVNLHKLNLKQTLSIKLYLVPACCFYVLSLFHSFCRRPGTRCDWGVWGGIVYVFQRHRGWGGEGGTRPGVGATENVGWDVIHNLIIENC